jgi:hypothetical protein
MIKHDYSYRYEREKAHALLRKLVPDAGARATIARLICDAASTASDSAPNSWVLRADPTELFLNVGQVAVVMVWRGALGLVTTQLGRRPSGLSYYRSPRGRSVYDAVLTPSSHLELPHEGLTKLSTTVRKQMRAFVRAAAADKTRSPWKRAHSPAVLDELAAEAGVEVSQPAYWGSELEHDEVLVTPNELSRDLESMREVERAAVDHVTLSYRRAGWQVRSRESEKVGYDLDCQRKGEVRHVEVKGRSAEGASVILTSGEWDRAKRDRAWILAVVSFAASERRSLREYSGRAVRASTGVEPLAFRVALS